METHEIVPRPDGRTYRARRRPSAEVLGGDWDDAAVIVWRTHDMDVATALAGQEWTRQVDGRDPLPGRVTVGWFRQFPFDPTGSYDWSVSTSSSTDRRAAPGVMFS
jgi:hypothetical protein